MRWKTKLKTVIRLLLSLVRLSIGLVIYLCRNKNSAFAYQAMIELFCLTRGKSNDVISKIISFFKRPYHFPESKGVLGVMDKQRCDQILSTLNEKGYFIFEQRLPEDLCNRLLQFATSHPCRMRGSDNDHRNQKLTVYPRNNPMAVRYDFDTQDVIDNPDVQKLFADLSLATVAQDYLKTKPVIDVSSIWWHTDYSDQPDSAAAQFFHFDMDRPKWIKFFIYLTDVGPNNGPHTFVAGSHVSGGIPSSLLKKGYARLTDGEVNSHFEEKNIVEFNAPRGTIIVEDTRGLHKGKHVQEGDRLILQVQYSNTLFGGNYPKFKLGNIVAEELKIKISQYPELFANYL